MGLRSKPRPNGHYYIAYGFGEPTDELEMFNQIKGKGFVENDFTDYDTALKYAKKSHKEEVEYQLTETELTSIDDIGDNGDIYDDFVMKHEDGYEDYPVARVYGAKCKVERYYYED
jgi:hypothetical protein